MMYSEIIQTVGLLFDIVGASLIANWLRKIEYKDSSPYGIATDTAKILTRIENTPLQGTKLLLLGFVVQVISVWI